MFKILGPKGRVIVRKATAARAKAILPALKKRFAPGNVKVVPIPTSHTPAPESTLRQKVVNWAHWGCANQPLIHYSEGVNRDDWLSAHPANRLPLYTDCSGFATLCYFLAGAPDPNGFGYKRLGYTGTLLAHCKHIPVTKVRPGDLVVYGTGTGHHAAVVVAVHAATLDGIVTVSHGQEAGPFEITVANEAKYQPAGITFLSILP